MNIHNVLKITISFCILLPAIIMGQMTATSYSLFNGDSWGTNYYSMYLGKTDGTPYGSNTKVRALQKKYNNGYYDNNIIVDSIYVSFTVVNDIGTSAMTIYFSDFEDDSMSYQERWNNIENGVQFDSIIVGDEDYRYEKVFPSGSSFVNHFLDDIDEDGEFEFSFYCPEAENLGDQVNRLFYIENEWINIYVYGPNVNHEGSVTFWNKTGAGNDVGGGLVVNDSIQVTSSESVVLQDGIMHEVVTNGQELVYNNLDYQHHYWNSTKGEYFLHHSFDTQFPDQTAKFDSINTVTIQSELSEITLDFFDPWYYDVNTQTQPDEFRPLAEQGDGNGNLQVFLDQNNTFDDNIPIYRMRAPAVYADANTIWVFDRWESPSADEAVFTAAGDITTTNRETKVVFKQAGARVTAHYNNASALGLAVTIPASETLSIPAGGHYDCAPGFQLVVEGDLTVDGSTDQITFTGDPSTPWNGIVIEQGGTVNLKDVIIGGSTTALTMNTAAFDDVSLESVQIQNSNVGVDINETWATGNLNISNCSFNHLSDTAIKMVDGETDWDYLGEIHVSGSSFQEIQNGIVIGRPMDGTEYTGWYWLKLSVNASDFINVEYPVQVYSTDRLDYYWPTPPPSDEFVTYIFENNTFKGYSTGMTIDGDMLLYSHNNVFDGNNATNSTGIDITYYELFECGGDLSRKRAFLVNETIVKNTVGIATHISTNRVTPCASEVVVLNSIFHGNGEDHTGNGLSVNIDFNHLAFDGDPFFVDFEGGIYALQGNSPCVNTGTGYTNPYTGQTINSDPDGTDLDLGAYYHPSQISGILNADVFLSGNVSIPDNLTVADNTILTVTEGAQLSIDPQVQIMVNGTLIVDGTATDPAVFDCDLAGATWRGIEMDGGHIEFNHGEIKNTGLPGIGARNGATGSVKNSDIHECVVGLRLNRADGGFKIENNQVYENSIGINVMTTNPVITGNNVHHNEHFGVALLSGANPVMKDNHIHHNGNGDSHAAGILMIGSSPILTNVYPSQSGGDPSSYPVNNHIHDNANKGIYISYSGQPNLGTQSTYSGREYGGFNHFHGNLSHSIYRNDHSTDQPDDPPSPLNQDQIMAQVNYWYPDKGNGGGPADSYGPFIWSPTAPEVFDGSINDDFDPLLTEGLIKEQETQYTEAMDIYQQYLDTNPPKDEAMLALSGIDRCKTKLKQVDEWREELEAISENFTNDEIKELAKNYLIWVYKKLDMDSEAIAMTESLLEDYTGTVWEDYYTMEMAMLVDETDGSILLREGQPTESQAVQMKAKQAEERLLTDLGDSEAAKIYRLLFKNEASGQRATNAPIPGKFALHPAYPNPFNPTTTLSFDLPEASEITFTIYDLTGREVKTLTHKPYQAGTHRLRWNGINHKGEAVASGMYLYMLTSHSLNSKTTYRQTNKMVLLK